MPELDYYDGRYGVGYDGNQPVLDSMMGGGEGFMELHWASDGDDADDEAGKPKVNVTAGECGASFPGIGSRAEIGFGRCLATRGRRLKLPPETAPCYPFHSETVC